MLMCMRAITCTTSLLLRNMCSPAITSPYPAHNISKESLLLQQIYLGSELLTNYIYSSYTDPEN